MAGDKPAGGGATGWGGTGWGNTPSGTPSSGGGGSTTTSGGSTNTTPPSGQQPIVLATAMTNPQTGELLHQGDPQYQYYASTKGSAVETFHSGQLVPTQRVVYYDAQGNVTRIQEPTANVVVSGKSYFGVDTSSGEWFSISSSGGQLYKNNPPQTPKTPTNAGSAVVQGAVAGSITGQTQTPTAVTSGYQLQPYQYSQTLEMTNPQGQTIKFAIPQGSDTSALLSGTSALNADITAGWKGNLITYTPPKETVSQPDVITTVYSEKGATITATHPGEKTPYFSGYYAGVTPISDQATYDKWVKEHPTTATGYAEKVIRDTPEVSPLVTFGKNVLLAKTPSFELPIIGGNVPQFSVLGTVLPTGVVDVGIAQRKTALELGGGDLVKGTAIITTEMGERILGVIYPTLNAVSPDIKSATQRGVQNVWENRGTIVGTAIVGGLIKGTADVYNLRAEAQAKATAMQEAVDNPQVVLEYQRQIGAGKGFSYKWAEEYSGSGAEHEATAYVYAKNPNYYQIQMKGILDIDKYNALMAEQGKASIALKDVSESGFATQFGGGQQFAKYVVNKYTSGLYTPDEGIVPGELAESSQAVSGRIAPKGISGAGMEYEISGQVAYPYKEIAPDVGYTTKYSIAMQQKFINPQIPEGLITEPKSTPPEVSTFKEAGVGVLPATGKIDIEHTGLNDISKAPSGEYGMQVAEMMKNRISTQDWILTSAKQVPTQEIAQQVYEKPITYQLQPVYVTGEELKMLPYTTQQGGETQPNRWTEPTIKVVGIPASTSKQGEGFKVIQDTSLPTKELPIQRTQGMLSGLYEPLPPKGQQTIQPEKQILMPMIIPVGVEKVTPLEKMTTSTTTSLGQPQLTNQDLIPQQPYHRIPPNQETTGIPPFRPKASGGEAGGIGAEFNLGLKFPTGGFKKGFPVSDIISKTASEIQFGRGTSPEKKKAGQLFFKSGGLRVPTAEQLKFKRRRRK